MLFFALAHGAYIRYFLCAGGLPARPAAWLLPAALLALLFAGVVPRVLDPAERIGVAVYGAVIAGMLYTVLRYRGAYAAWFRFAALLFVFSDGVIAWSRSRAHLCRDGSLLPGAVPVLLLCRKIASRPPV